MHLHAVANHGLVVGLAVQHRQVGAGGAAGAQFLGAVRRIKTGAPTPAGLKPFTGRALRGGLSPAAYAAVAEHECCVHLFSTNKRVNEHNLNMLGQFGGSMAENPVLLAAATNSNDRVKKLNTQGAGGAPNVFVFRRGARAMLRRNLITGAGLVNGAIGAMVGVGYSGPPRLDGMPSVVLMAPPCAGCTLPSFEGLTYTDAEGGGVHGGAGGAHCELRL